MLIHVKELPFSKTEQTTPPTVINQPKAPYLRLLPTTYNPTQKNRSREESELVRTALNFEIARLISDTYELEMESAIDIFIRDMILFRNRLNAGYQITPNTLHGGYDAREVLS